MLDQRIDVVGHELFSLGVVGVGVDAGRLGGCCLHGIGLAGSRLSERGGQARQQGYAKREEQFDTGHEETGSE